MTIRINEVAVIDNSRNAVNLASVGVGTASPSSNLHVVGAGTQNTGLTIAEFRNSANASRIEIVDETATGSKPPGVMSPAGFGLGLYARSGPMIFYQGSSDTERMRITSAGNVGIGTTSPALRLDVSGSIRSSQSITIGTGGTYEAGSIYSDANWGMIFRAKQANPNTAQYRWANSADAELMRIDNSGNVGIGTTAPTYKLQAHTSASAALQNGLNISNGANADFTVRIRNNETQIGPSPNIPLLFTNNNGTERMRIAANGNVGIGTSSPQTTLDILREPRTGTGPSTPGAIYATSTIDESANGIEFRHTNQTQGIGFGFNTIYATGTNTNQDIGLRARGNGNVRFFNGAGSELVRITGTGNVGIRTTAPTAPLHIKVSGTPPTSGTQGFFGNVIFEKDGNHWNRIRFDKSGAAQWGIASNPDDQFVISRFSINPNAADDTNFVIATNGNVGIGTTSPSQRLTISGGAFRVFTTAGQFTRANFDSNDSNVSPIPNGGISELNAGDLFLRSFWGVSVDINGGGLGDSGSASNSRIPSTSSFTVNTRANATTFTNLFTVRNSGNVGINTTSPSQRLHVVGNILASGNVTAFSDRRFKTNIETIDDAINKITQLRGVYYTRTDTDDADQVHTGVIAQELLPVLPEVVGGDEQSGYSVAYGHMAGLFIEAIKSQQATIAALDQRVKNLESQQTPDK